MPATPFLAVCFPNMKHSYAGGVTGKNDESTTNCYNTGTVLASAEKESYAYAGGIAGSSGGSITNCYNMSTVSAINYYAGGIAGTNSGSITNCYNTGTVFAEYDAGRIVGSNFGSIASCYYNAPDLKAEGGTALTLKEMKQQTSYVGFDFETVWRIDSESYYPFPVLQGMAMPKQEEENTTEFAGGTGRFDNPYQVATVEHLDNVRKYLDAYYIQTADIDLTEATSEGGAFYNDGSGWAPIGTDEKTPFTGNYDGGGYRIIGLKCNQSNSGTRYASLFGYNSGVIQNLGIDVGAVSSYYSYAGGIAGYNRGSVINCYNTGTISAEDYAGGITGYNSGSITNCYNTGTVSAISYAGGITGYNSGSITNCYNKGTVSAGRYAGGIAGYYSDGLFSVPSITNCYNTGAVSAGSYAGGIAGSSGGSITNCHNTGTISAEDYAGGIAGYIGKIGITNCYNKGTVSAEGYAGGIAGYNSDGLISAPSITNCYNTGAISSYYSCAGGIAGYNIGSITNCYNTGTVSAEANAGGITGYNSGSITDCYNKGTVSAEDYAGGIIGLNFSGISITNCYYYDAPNLKTKYGTALTLEEMKQQTSYVGFDFETVWSISPDKNGGYPTLQGLPAPEDAPTVPEEPTEPTGNDVTITLSKKSYDESTGTYRLTITLQNQGKESISGTVLFAAYNDGRFVSLREYAVELEPNGTQTIPAEITTNDKVEQLKVFCWDMSTLQPFGNAAETAG